MLSLAGLNNRGDRLLADLASAGKDVSQLPPADIRSAGYLLLRKANGLQASDLPLCDPLLNGGLFPHDPHLTLPLAGTNDCGDRLLADPSSAR